MWRTLILLSLVAAISASLVSERPLSAAQRRRFFPRPRPMPPPTNPDSGPTRTNQRQIMLIHAHRQRMYMQMMMARMQPHPFYPQTTITMAAIPAPYPVLAPQIPIGNFPLIGNLPAPLAEKPLPLLAGIVNAQGQMSWPLGLQILRPALEMKEARQRVESLLNGAAQQAAKTGRAPAQMLDDAGQAMMQLQQALRQQREEMAETTYRDAAAFLRRLESVLQTMR